MANELMNRCWLWLW